MMNTSGDFAHSTAIAEKELHGFATQLLEALQKHPFLPASPRAPLVFPKGVKSPPQFVLENEAGLLLGGQNAPSFSVVIPLPPLGRNESSPLQVLLRTPSTPLLYLHGDPIFPSPIPHRPAPGLASFGRKVKPQVNMAAVVQVVFFWTRDPLTPVLFAQANALRSLANRIPGYLAQSRDTHLDARIHPALLTQQLTPAHLASELARAVGPLSCNGSAMVFFSWADEAMAEDLHRFVAPLGQLRQNLESTRRSTPGLNPDCDGRSCATCDENAVCEKIRDYLKWRAGK